MESINVQSRFDGKDHWALYDRKPSRSLCKIKGCQNRTHIFCKKCEVYLCLNTTRNCFLRFHIHDVDLLTTRQERKTLKSLNECSPDIENKSSTASLPTKNMLRSSSTVSATKIKNPQSRVNVENVKNDVIMQPPNNVYCLRTRKMRRSSTVSTIKMKTMRCCVNNSKSGIIVKKKECKTTKKNITDVKLQNRSELFNYLGIMPNCI